MKNAVSSRNLRISSEKCELATKPRNTRQEGLSCLPPKDENCSRKHIFQRFLSNKAESLIETIIATTVIALGATGAAVLIRIALLGNELSQDRMLALSLMHEGTSAINVIIDTNFIRYGGELDSCWNSLEGTSSEDCADNLIENNTYYILKTDIGNLGYYLEKASESDVFDNEYKLYLCDFGGAALYTNPGNDTESYCGEETTFYRSIYVTYDTGNPFDATAMNVISEVGWTTEGQQKTVSEDFTILK